MKIISLFLFLIFSLLQVSFAQDCYTVIKVKGDVLLEKNRSIISINDEICSGDNLIFSNEDNVVVVHSTAKGRFTLKPNKRTESELIFMVNDVLKQSGNIFTRDITFSLADEFRGVYYIIGETRILVDTDDFPMNGDKFFYIRYFYNNDTINAKLRFDGDTLILDKETIFRVNGVMINPDDIKSVLLYYYDSTNKTSELISEFTLRFADEEKLKEELGNYYALLKKTNKSEYEIMNNLYSYFNDVYGRVNIASFMKWVNENIKN